MIFYLCVKSQLISSLVSNYHFKLSSFNSREIRLEIQPHFGLRSGIFLHIFPDLFTYLLSDLFTPIYAPLLTLLLVPLLVPLLALFMVSTTDLFTKSF